ncbi:MAG: hypothetical protein EYC69_08165 [Bacteroidetes bacterium]|nr:MAG: hypothetical protein EYC69_08165 [Bacteroidota bacterium]
MRKLFLCYSIFIASILTVEAGTPGTELFNIGPGYNQVYSLYTDYSFASGTVTNQFANEYFRSGFITNEMKDEVSKNLFHRNTLGAEFNASITIAQKLDTLFGSFSGISFIRISNKAHIHAKFENDLFEMYFRGNKNYAGKKAELGPFKLKSYTYQQLTYGIERSSERKNKHIIWSTAVSLNIGQKYSGYDSQSSSLYTAPDGSFLDVNLDLRLRSSDSSQSKPGSFNGYGFSIDGMVIIRDEKQNAWSISASNLGYIQWTKESAEVPIDSSFRFEGIDVTDIFDFSDTIRKEITTDSAYVQSFLTDRRKKAFSDMVPFHLKASYSAQLNPGKLILDIGAEQIFFAEARLRGFTELKYNFKRRHQLALNLSYGAYTFWNLGLGYKGQAGKSWVFCLGTDYLSSMLNNGKGLSQGAFVSLEKYF